MVKGKDDEDEGGQTAPYEKRSSADADDQVEIPIEVEPEDEGVSIDGPDAGSEPQVQAAGQGVLILVVIPDRNDGTGRIDVPDKINPRSRMPDAYQVLWAILQERRQGITKALFSNFMRKSWSAKRGLFTGLCSLIGGFVGIALVGDPIGGFAIGGAIGAAGPVVVDTSQIRRTKLTNLRKEYPDTPEFRDPWAVCCYELMVIVRGFNARVEVVKRVIEMSGNVNPRRSSAMLKTAREMAAMLNGVRTELAEACEILAQYQPDNVETIIAIPECGAAIKLIDPLKGGKFDWLILDPETIPVGREHEQLERDRREAEAFAESLKEVADEIDPFEALRRRQEEGEDPPDR